MKKNGNIRWPIHKLYKISKLDNLIIPFKALKINFRALSWVFVIVAISANTHVGAQTGGSHDKITPDTAHLKLNDSIARQKDAIDILAYWFHRQRSYEKDTTEKKAGKLFLSVLPGIGYADENGFSVVANVIGAFYTSEGKDANISSVSIAPNITQKNQFICPLVSDVWTKGNKLDFLSDLRYYIYPSVTYGLGGNTTLADADKINYQFIRFYQQVLKELAPDLVGGIGYNLDYHYDIKDNIGGTYEGGGITDFSRYDGGHINPTSSSSGLSVNLLYDTRRNLINPVGGGSYANIFLRQNLTALGSDANYETVLLDFRKYFRFPYNSHNVLAIWNFYWLTIGNNPPYLDLPSTSWDTYSSSCRGYPQDRYRGRNMLYLEAEYRMSLSRNGLFGAVVFSNLQAFSQEWPNNSINTLIPAVGAGFRFKINKLSNTNFCLDYGIGRDGGTVFLNLGELF